MKETGAGIGVTTSTKTVQTKENLPYYLTAVGIFVSLKFSFTYADNNNLMFLLSPTNKLVEFLTGSHSLYLSESGYFYDQHNIIIDKSCSGFNFWVLGFLLFSYMALKHFDRTFDKILIIPSALIASYLLTIFVNTSRIFTSMVVQAQSKNLLLNQQHIVHEAIGIVTNLTFLILAYLLAEKLLIHKRDNGKFA